MVRAPRDPGGSLRRGLHALEERAECADDRVVAFAEQRGENVLADPLAPDVIAAITPRDRGGIEVDPVGVVASDYVVPSVSDSLPVEGEGSFETVEVNAAGGGEVDCYACHSLLRSHSPSQFVAGHWTEIYTVLR